MVFLKYQWKLQIRKDKDSQWRDDGEPPKIVELPNYKTHEMEKVPNSFKLDLAEGEPVPEQFYGIPGGRANMVYEVRTVLESVDAGGNKVTHLINFYEKVDPHKPWIPNEGIAYLECMIDDCGATVAPGRQLQHLIDNHGKRLKYLKDKEIDQTNSKYFKVHLLHGKTITEAFKEKANPASQIKR